MNDQNDAQNTENKKDKKTYKTLERVTIEEDLKEKLNSLTATANKSLQGITEVSKSDVVNLILKLHDNGLSKLETDELRKTHFDVLKCLTWLQNQARAAKDNGNEVSLKDLFAKSSEFMAELTGPTVQKIRKPRKRKNSESSEDLESPHSEEKDSTSE